jgi:hypothetical protein
MAAVLMPQCKKSGSTIRSLRPPIASWGAVIREDNGAKIPLPNFDTVFW